MKELIQQNFVWFTISVIILMVVITRFISHILNRILRHRNIMKYGYPPPHCDADGDFKEETTE